MSANNGVKVSQATRQKIWEKSHGRCWYCGKTEEPMSIDHIVPLSHGGKDNPNNLVPRCRSCNSRKKTKSLEEYREWLTRHNPVFFSDEQIEFLSKFGITLPSRPKHVFWFEQRGLNKSK